MIRNKTIKRAIYFATAFFALFSILLVLKNWYGTDTPFESKKQAIAISATIDGKNNLPEKWKYSTQDKSNYALPTYNDSVWQTINLKLNPDSVPHKLFGNIIWFRSYFSVDTSYINKILSLRVIHYGASEIYLDGKLVKKYGVVSPHASKEQGIIPDVPVLFSLPDTKKHLLAIRYSNCNALTYFKKYDEDLGGLRITLIPDAYDGIDSYRQNNATNFVFLCLFGFFLTLSIVHFLLYIFYRKQKQNLYYSLFVFTFSLVVFLPYFQDVIRIPSAYLFISYINELPALLLLPSLVGCLYILFKPDHAKTLFIIGTIITLVTILTFYYPPFEDFNGVVLFALIIFTCIESIRSVITGVLRKQEGAKIIGTGVVVFFIFVLTIILIAFVTESNVSIKINGLKGIILFSFVMLAVISIPLSMSIYLARNFAYTNKHLNNKLIEVEELSAKNMLQEKEKQQLLASQNERLEQQVQERTHEVVKQKEIIEERNKDITDSIHYAKRIQHALLANKKMLDENLKNYFLFFNPKDIVSGDFYWAAKINDVFYLAISDSTGHGVPGAFMSLLNMSFLNEAISEKQIQKPNEILSYVRKRLIESLKDDGSEEGGKDGMDCTLIAFHTQTNVLEFSCANNPLVLWRNTKLIEYPSDRMPVGKSPRENEPFTLQTIQLEANDVVYLFTDGYTDQFGGPKGKKFKYKQLEDLLLANGIQSLEQQKQLFEKAFNDWKGELEQVDDVTLFAFKI